MCKIFIGADPALYATSTRSIRLHGVVTSIRLEVIFWNILTEIGLRDGMSLSQLITKLHDEIIEARGEVDNFASFLRVCGTRYLSLQLLGGIPRTPRCRSDRLMRTRYSLWSEQFSGPPCRLFRDGRQTQWRNSRHTPMTRAYRTTGLPA